MRKLKSIVQQALRSLGIYQRLKSSPVYDFYWRAVDRSVIDDREKEVDFYRNLLRGFHKGDLIFDIGANRGIKTDMFLRLGARVIAVEPDEACCEILRRRFLEYRFFREPVAIVQGAVSDRDTLETLWIDEPGSAENTLSSKWVETLRSDVKRFGHGLNFSGQTEVETTTLEMLIGNNGLPFFIKVDVEGYELHVLRGLRQPVPYLSFEVNLPEFRSEGLQCVDVLETLASGGKFNYTDDCRRGLALKQWLAPQEFSPLLARCVAPSIEVFWRTDLA